MSIKNKITKSSFYCYLLIVIVFVAIRMLSEFNVLSFLGPTGKYILNAFIQIGLLFTISVFMFKSLTKSKTKDVFSFYGYKKISWRAVLISIAIGIVVYVLNIFVATFFNTLLSAIGYKFSSSSLPSSYPVWLLLINLFVTAFLPAVCEETAHRGMLLKSMSCAGKWKAIIISSLLFGLLHLNIEQFFYATLIGLLLGFITTGSDTIYPAMIIHFMNNAISVLMGFSKVRGLGLDAMFTWINYSAANNPVVGMIFVLCLITLLSMLLIWLINKLFKHTIIKNISVIQNELFKEIARKNYIKQLNDVAQGNEVNDNVPISFEEFDQMYQSKSLALGHTSEIENKMLSDPKPYKMDGITKTLMITAFILTAAVTIFTLIWGIL